MCSFRISLRRNRKLEFKSQSVQGYVHAVLTALLCARIESLCVETESMSLNTKLRACHAHSTVMYSTRISLRRNRKHEFKSHSVQDCVRALLTELFCTRLNQSLCGEAESMSLNTKLRACHVTQPNCFLFDWISLFAGKLKA